MNTDQLRLLPTTDETEAIARRILEVLSKEDLLVDFVALKMAEMALLWSPESPAEAMDIFYIYSSPFRCRIEFESAGRELMNRLAGRDVFFIGDDNCICAVISKITQPEYQGKQGDRAATWKLTSFSP